MLINIVYRIGFFKDIFVAKLLQRKRHPLTATLHRRALLVRQRRGYTSFVLVPYRVVTYVVTKVVLTFCYPSPDFLKLSVQMKVSKGQEI